MTGPHARSPDVVILGGGIAGLTMALAAAARGMRVVLVDQPRHGAASGAAAGMLAPSLEGTPANVLPFALAARDFYPGFLSRLLDRTGVHVPLDRRGIIEVALDPLHLARMLEGAGPDAVSLDRQALGDLEPALVGHGGVLHPNDGAIDNVTLMSALHAAVAGEPLVARIVESGAAVDLTHGDPAVILASGQRISGHRLAFAAGPWAATVPGLPRALPVRPVSGQLLTLASSAVTHVTYGGGGYLVPRGAALLVGATSEHTGFESVTTITGRDALLGIARSAAPEMANARILQHWSGLRPVTPDALPILGADPADARLVYACGFSRNGILLAPLAAESLAAILAGERSSGLIDFLGVGRFGETATV